MAGTTRNRSVSRMRSWSTQPPKYPATAPQMVPDQRRQQGHRETDLQRDLAGVEHLGQRVAPELIGSEPMGLVGRRPGRGRRS